MLLLRGQRPDRAAYHHFRAGEARLFQQGLEPGLEFFIEVVDEDRARGCNGSHVCRGGAVQLAIAASPDDRPDVEAIAADIGEHISKDAERRDHRDRLGDRRRADQQQRGNRDQAAPHHAGHPVCGANCRRAKPAPASDIPNSSPAVSTIAGPDGRLA